MCLAEINIPGDTPGLENLCFKTRHVHLTIVLTAVQGIYGYFNLPHSSCMSRFLMKECIFNSKKASKNVLVDG